MKWRVRYSGLALAVFLGLVVWAIYLQWPDQPLWRKPGQTFAGYDASQHTIFTISKTALKNKNDTSLPVNAWQLETGNLIRVIDCQLHEMNNNGWPDWALVSPDASLLAVYANNKSFVQLFNILDGKPRGPLIHVDDPLDSLGFSSDGRLLSLNTVYWVRVWDTQTMKMVFDYKLDKKRVSSSVDSFNSTRINRISFSEDNRFLAVDTSINVHVFDLHSMKHLGTTECTGVPRILPDGQTLLVMAFSTSFPVISRFRMKADGIIILPQKSCDLFPYETSVDLQNEHLVTLQKKTSSWRIPLWLPNKWQRQLYQWNNELGWPHYIRLLDLESGAISKSREIRIKQPMGFTSGELMPGYAVKLLDQSHHLVIEERDNLVVWQTSTYRGFSFWLIEVLFGLLIILIGIKSFKRSDTTLNATARSNYLGLFLF